MPTPHDEPDPPTGTPQPLAAGTELASLPLVAVPRVNGPAAGGSAAEIMLRLDAERAARASAEAALRRASFVSDVTAKLLDSLDFERRLADLAWACVPTLGDWCAIDLVGDDGAFRRLAFAHPDPAKVALALDLEARYPEDPTAPVSRARVLASGTPSYAPELTDAILDAVARDAEHARLIRALGLRSYIVAPLCARDRPLGTITVVSAESGRRYDEGDVALVSDLARRVGMLIENARLHSELLAQRALLEEQAAELELQHTQLQDTMTELEMAHETLQEQAVELETSNTQLQEAQLTLELQADELTRRNAELERSNVQLGDAARELAAQHAMADGANRAKAEFLAMMSHELRTPLNAIGGYVELLELGIRGPLTEAQCTDLARVRRAQRHLLAVITDILNFARLEQGKVQLTVRAVPVVEALEVLDAMLAPQVSARGLAYRVEPAEPGLAVRADGERLAQILLNLGHNAAKFTAVGGVTVSVAVLGDRVAIHVRDTGRGIAAERLASVFEPFVQIDRHRTAAVDQGLGLGLPISRELARAMGGDLTAESEPGVGSTFTLTLSRA